MPKHKLLQSKGQRQSPNRGIVYQYLTELEQTPREIMWKQMGPKTVKQLPFKEQIKLLIQSMSTLVPEGNPYRAFRAPIETYPLLMKGIRLGYLKRGRIRLFNTGMNCVYATPKGQSLLAP